MQPDANAAYNAANAFQSSSSQKAGCNRRLLDIGQVVSVFQSSSSQKAGCNIEPSPASC